VEFNWPCFTLRENSTYIGVFRVTEHPEGRCLHFQDLGSTRVAQGLMRMVFTRVNHTENK
jgi:hypothetical protein